MSYQSPSNRTVCGIVAIIFGSLGIHKFIMGKTTVGLIMLAVSTLTFGIGATVMMIIGIIEGIAYLTRTDAEWEREYIHGGKDWL